MTLACSGGATDEHSLPDPENVCYADQGEPGAERISRQDSLPQCIPSPRGLDKSLMLRLAGCTWIREHQVVLIAGATGTGKSYLACALGHAACRQGLSVRYYRFSRLLGDLAVARGDGSYAKLLDKISRTELLILDDFGLAPLADTERRDLLEVLEDRYGRRATLMTSQLPLDHWHEVIGNPTFGDAILDRLVHHANRLTLKGASLRRKARPGSTSPAQAAD